MADKKQDKISAREYINGIYKVCRAIYSLDHGWFFLAALSAAMDAAVQYLVLLLSAWALTESAGQVQLAGHAQLTAYVRASEILQWPSLVRTLVLFIGTILAGHILSGILSREVAVRQEALTARFQTLLSEKIMQMDFSVADSPRLRKLRDKIRKENGWGEGISGICRHCNFVFVSLFKIIGGIMIAVPVLQDILRQKSVGAVSLLLLMVLLTAFFTWRWKKEETEYREKRKYDLFETTEEMAKKSGLIWPLAEGTLFSWQSGKDVRIYEGDALFQEYTLGRMERYERERIKEYGKLFREKERHFYFGQQFLMGISYFMVTFVALAGTLEIGALVKYAGALGSLLTNVSMMVTHLFWVGLSSRSQLSALELLQVPDEMYKGKLPVEKRSDFEYEIEFSHVWFCYPGAEDWALRDFSLKLEVGKKLAIVGMNGSGKTTMIKLLCRLYEPTQGEILLNGVDIRKFEEDEYRRLFSVVFQDLSLFSLKLGENVAGSGEYDAEKVKKCLQDAGFGERLERLSEGLESYLYKDFEDSGVDISGGEAQKIAIARALYKDAPFILLDEPTAALDPKAEYEIYTSFDKMVGKKTAIYISHRLSSCRFCDDIAVFDQGQLVQRGSHEELVRDQNGKYFELWNAQAQYYQ